MKKYLSAILLITSLQGIAQTPDNRGIYVGDILEDVELGWMNTIVVKEPSKPFSQYGWSYTAAQTDVSQKIGSWIQQTFSQRGLLAEIKLTLLAPEPSFPISSKEYDFNEAQKNNINALPNSYGAYVKFHRCISKTATKKFWPTPGNHCYTGLDIMVNNVQLISHQVVGLSSTDEYYCFMPKYTPGMTGRFDKDWMPSTLAYRNFNNSPNLKNYEHYLVPGKLIDQNGNAYIVVMTKDNKPLPFEQVTMGELIARIELQFPMLHKIAVNSGLTTRMPKVVEDARRGFQIFKNRFRDRLSKYVYSADGDLNIDLLSFSQIEEGKEIYWIRTEEVYKGQNGWVETNFPLLKMNQGVKQALATGAPEWIIFKIDAPTNPGYNGNVQLMDNFVSRFNYDYVYRYFFGKDKVIEPYKPLGAVAVDGKKENNQPAVLSAMAQKKAGDKSILFFEDFSGTTVGSAPQGWTTQRSDVSGNEVSVMTVENVEGKWLQLKRNATPKNFPQDIKGDFEMSYDLLVRKGDVPWGTPGIDMELRFSGSGGDRKIGLDVSPGDMNRSDAAGWVIFNGLTGCKVSNYYSLPDFTGSKAINKATISLQKKGQTLVVKCNNSKIYECATAFPSDFSLKGLNFYVNEKNQYYLSNIQIRKL
ncbi:MAG: hypothetical protein J7527_12250 [Chitinophagaceae bacterium]|nr:hypothetical protein [Chitinophagaceae bacterium]